MSGVAVAAVIAAGPIALMIFPGSAAASTQVRQGPAQDTVTATVTESDTVTETPTATVTEPITETATVTFTATATATATKTKNKTTTATATTTTNSTTTEHATTRTTRTLPGTHSVQVVTVTSLMPGATVQRTTKAGVVYKTVLTSPSMETLTATATTVAEDPPTTPTAATKLAPFILMGAALILAGAGVYLYQHRGDGRHT